MDKPFIYLFTVWAVTVWISFISGVEAGGLAIGLVLPQGEPASIITQKNEELVLNCSVKHASDLGDLTVVWVKDDAPIVIDRRVQQFPNGSLYIRRIIHRPKKNRTDEGRYKCFATLQNGTDRIGRVIARDVHVLVAGIEKKFEMEPEPQTVPTGGVARFQCKIHSVPPAMYIRWERDKTPLPQNDTKYMVFKYSGILQITGVTETDAGLYRCYATQGLLHELPGHNIDPKYSEEALLQVVKVPVGNQVKIVYSSKNVTALVRTPALLECLVEGTTSPVHWTKGDARAAVLANDRIKRKWNNLQFLETESSDEGKYECRVGNVRSSMTLNIIRKPVITDVTPSTKVPRAKWVYLECRADGHPKPTISWYKDGELIVYDPKYNYEKRQDQLVIVISQPYNSGYYQCLASNDAGSVSAFTRVNIYKPADSPEMPTNLTAVKVSSTSILISWLPAKVAMNSIVIAYTVHYRKDGAQKEEIVTSYTEISLEQLSPFSEYTIYVHAFTSSGQGPSSENLIVKTLEGRPSRPPVINLKARATAIFVKWEPLPEKYHNGIISQYKILVRVKESNSRVRTEMGISGSATAHLITGLQPDTEYMVRMLAGTSIGFRETLTDDQWPWVSVKTLAVSYVLAPDVTVRAINTTMINVSWAYADTFSVKQFTVRLQLIPSEELLHSETLPAESTHTVFSKLDKNAMYQVTVIVQTLDGEESEAVEEYSSLNVLTPAGPQNLHVTLKSSTSINVEWEEPISDKEIESFTVRYRQAGLVNYKFVNSQTNTALLLGLLPFKEYEISVRANAETSVSHYSDKITAYTNAGVPSEPLSVHIQMVKHGSVRVNWQPPAKPNGQIKSYTILYTNMPTKSDDLWIRVEKNGSENSAQITITDMSGKMYYFKLHANTELGPGKNTQPFSVDASVPVTDHINAGQTVDQTLGIIIGISISVFCIIVCIIIILLRHRCFGNNSNQQPQTQPARFHGNGHIPGNGNGHAVPMQESHPVVGGVYEMDAYTPMLEHLPENEQSDSKGGGGSSVLLTSNGAKLNGFASKHNGIVNGHIPNGHVTSFLQSHYNDGNLDGVKEEEKRGLLAAMLAGNRERCITTNVEVESFTTSRHDDLGSLDNIDMGSSEDGIHKTTGKEQENSGEDSGEGSLTASDRTSSEYGSSIPRSDTTDTGDTVVFCGSSSRRQDTAMGGELYARDGIGERSDMPVDDIPQSSLSCEDMCHEGGVQLQPSSLNVQESRRVSGSVLPQDDGGTEMFSAPNNSTSISLSQATIMTDSIGASETRPAVTRKECDGDTPQVICNGSSPGVSTQSRRRHHATSNGVLPQMFMNGYPAGTNGVPPQMNTMNNMVICRPQGLINGRSTAENNPNQSRTSTEAMYRAEEIPQDVTSAIVDSSSRKGHFQEI